MMLPKGTLWVLGMQTEVALCMEAAETSGTQISGQEWIWQKQFMMFHRYLRGTKDPHTEKKRRSKLLNA